MCINKTLKILLTVFILLLSSCQSNYEPNNKSNTTNAEYGLEISVLDIGKADSIIIKTTEGCAIIDCGEIDDGNKILSRLKKKGISKIDYLFITHFDKDHVGGAPQVIEGIETGQIITPDYEGSNSEYASYKDTVKDNKFNVLAISKDMDVSLGDVSFKVFAPSKEEYVKSDNNNSLVIEMTYGEKRFLFMADAEAKRIKNVLPKLSGKYDILKVPHHGRISKRTDELIETVCPKYSVICDSIKNPAEKETLNLLNEYGSNVFCTKNRDIEILCDGREITVNQ